MELELRLILLAIGLVIIGLIYIWGMRKKIQESLERRRRLKKQRSAETLLDAMPVVKPAKENAEQTAESDPVFLDDVEIRVIDRKANAPESPDSMPDSDPASEPGFNPDRAADHRVASQTAETAPMTLPETAPDPVFDPHVRSSALGDAAPVMSQFVTAENEPQPEPVSRSGLPDFAATASSRQADFAESASAQADTVSAAGSAAERAAEKSNDLAADEPAATGPEMTVLLTVVAPNGRPFSGAAIREASRELALPIGEHGVLECNTDSASQKNAKTVFSVAHLREPGIFNIDTLDSLTTPGLLLFMHLPGPLSATESVRMMFGVAGQLAEKLGGTVCDEKRRRFTQDGYVALHRQASQFEQEMQGLAEL